MAERLTERQNNSFYTGKGNELGDILNKLGELEDIMDKYNIKTISQLKARLSGEDKSHKSAMEYMKDRDTWQKACELACETMTKLGGDDCCGCRLNKEMCKICENKKGLIDYFYQQAKKEGNDERKN